MKHNCLKCSFSLWNYAEIVYWKKKKPLKSIAATNTDPHLISSEAAELSSSWADSLSVSTVTGVCAQNKMPVSFQALTSIGCVCDHYNKAIPSQRHECFKSSCVFFFFFLFVLCFYVHPRTEKCDLQLMQFHTRMCNICVGSQCKM